MSFAANADGTFQVPAGATSGFAADCGCCEESGGIPCVCPLPNSVTVTTTGALPAGWTVTSGSWNGPWTLSRDTSPGALGCSFVLADVVTFTDELGNPGSRSAFAYIGPPQFGLNGLEVQVLAPGYGGNPLGDVCCRSSYVLDDLDGTSATVTLGTGPDVCPCDECCRTLQFVNQVCDVVTLRQQMGCNWTGGRDGCLYRVWQDSDSVWRSTVVCAPDPTVYAAHSTTTSTCPPATGWVGDPTAVPRNLCCDGDDCPCSGGCDCGDPGCDACTYGNDCCACADAVAHIEWFLTQDTPDGFASCPGVVHSGSVTFPLCDLSATDDVGTLYVLQDSGIPGTVRININPPDAGSSGIHPFLDVPCKGGTATPVHSGACGGSTYNATMTVTGCS